MDQISEASELAVLKFAQKLAVNQPKFRAKAVRKLRRWMQMRSAESDDGFSEDDFLKIWKGLHYCMWMADKPVFQENLAEEISSLISCFTQPDIAFRFASAFFKTEAREWFGIDRLRLDKFMTLMRKMFRHSLMVIQEHGWSDDHIKVFSNILRDTIVNGTNERVPDGLKYHFIDIFLDEIKDVGAGALSRAKVALFMEPFSHMLGESQNKTIATTVKKRIFEPLVAFASRSLRRPKNHSNEEDVMVEDKDEADKELLVDFKACADHLFLIASRSETLNRSVIYQIVKLFQDAEQGIFPEEEQFSDFEEVDTAALERDAVSRLMKTANSVKKLSKRKRRQVDRESSDDEEVNDDDDDEDLSEESVKKPKKQKKKKNKIVSGDGLADEPRKKKRKIITNMDDSEQMLILNGDGEVETSEGENAEDALATISKLKKDLKKGRKDTSTSSSNTSTITVQTTTIVNSKNSTVQTTTVVNSNAVEKLKKKVKKMKKVEDVNCVAGGEDSDEIVVSKKKEGKQVKKNKSKKLGESTDHCTATSESDMTSSPDLVEGEVEIWVPNKKYKGAMKLVEQSRPTPTSASWAKACVPFATFENGYVPPAFVKKMKSPNPGTPKQSATLVSVSTSEKKVKFVMSMNRSQNFEDSLHLTPKLAFNPKLVPEQGILKPSPFSTVKGVKSLKQKNSNKKPCKMADSF